MTEVKDILDRLGLSQYVDSFLAEGFDTWEILSEITESDLTHLNVKLGHRRKLQRTIADFRGQSDHLALSSCSYHKTNVQSESGTSAVAHAGTHGTSHTVMTGPRKKRKYKRHPKADHNAPGRPDSAYVMFSNHMRELLKDHKLSFTDMAKVTGEWWQALPADRREEFDSHASVAKAKYNAELAEYRKTDQYEQYQTYLEEFKSRGAAVHTEVHGKRTKVVPGTSTETQEVNELGDGVLVRPRSATSGYMHQSSPSDTTNRHEAYSKTTSPAISHFSEAIQSPRSIDRCTSFSTSPTTCTLPLYTNHAAGLRYSDDSFPEEHRRSKSELLTVAPFPHTASSLYNASQDSSGSSQSRGPTRQQVENHISVCGRPHYSGGYPSTAHDLSHSPFPTMMQPDIPRSARVLPAPMHLKIGPPLTLEHRPALISTYAQHEDPRLNFPLAALLQAGKLASEREAALPRMSGTCDSASPC